MTYIECFIIVAMLAAFVVTLAKKWGLVEYMQVHGNDLFSRMANCDFCLSFWASWLVALPLFCFTGNVYFLVAPFCSTMICRFVL